MNFYLFNYIIYVHYALLVSAKILFLHNIYFEKALI